MVVRRDGEVGWRKEGDGIDGIDEDGIDEDREMC